MLSRTTRDRPDKAAIVCGGRGISYAELHDEASRLAGTLLSSGIAPGERVAILAPKCAEEVTAIFAAAMAGCALVHINPSFREPQIVHVLSETTPAALLFHPSRAAMLERVAMTEPLPKLLINLISGSASEASCRIAEADASRDGGRIIHEINDQIDEHSDLAAIIYTSGTTACAKGIMVTHDILAESTRVSAQILHNCAADRLISLTPFSFDGALSQLFTAVLVGGTLVLQTSPLPKDVIHTLVCERVTGLHAVPSFWRMMLAQLPRLGNQQLPHLRYISLIGEPLPEHELEQLRQQLGEIGVFVMYGTTEAFRSTCLEPADLDRKMSSVGRPLPGVEIDIVDAHGQPCAIGEVGEIVHRGAFVSPGYWRRDGSTVFQEDGVHTGDQGRLDQDGYLYFTGRKDSMIKRMGYQVYPEEIEACLQEMSEIAMASVVGVSDASGRPGLHAYVVRNACSSLDEGAIRRRCRRSLPFYMVPDEISICSSMPTTASGKIDRAQLAVSG